MLRGRSSKFTISDEVQIFWNKVHAVVHDKNMGDIKLDVVALLLYLKSAL
jgi:hypothetical protein